ncbi:hypothetical protein RU09_15175 [Microbacterium sp. MEJ108Y]|nr:hypothetical protein RU09_15175 [Microbacterium sp. MEJ108Y]
MTSDGKLSRMFLKSDSCGKHAWLAHVAAHEAGHATAALVLGFEFVEVQIPREHVARANLADAGIVVAGGVQMQGLPDTWVPGREEDALSYFAAGSRSELMLLGDNLASGLKGDLDQWLLGIGRPSGMPMEESRPVEKRAFQRVEALLVEHRPALRRIARGLYAPLLPGAKISALGPDEPLVLSYDELRRLFEGVSVV